MKGRPDARPTRIDALPEPVRSKAREVLKQLLGEGRDEQEAVEIAIAQAREWEQTRAVRQRLRQRH